MEHSPSFSYEDSAGDTHKQTVTSLPPEVVQCLDNARFLHLGTCTNNQPHVSLMNYTYLPSSPYSTEPTIIMTSNPSSKKANNLVENPNVSLLVHDWVSHRPPTQGRRPSGGSPGPEHRSSLASLLQDMNASALSSTSATMNGVATLIPPGSDEERYYREQHLENNTFDTEAGAEQSRSREDGGSVFLAGEEVRVIVVKIRDVRTSDWKGVVRDYVLAPATGAHGTGVNGVA
ncbi:pyridoxamine 5'-phosphate oxidase [Apiospora aurea]|uniref:Pyridoxamine 5'-phosphate oxidase n=1 Tax=Apiospora aurea TaxID=335848 RepID=A0ABR1QSI9_9PEZI